MTDFERSYPWISGDRYYLQATQRVFQEMLLSGNNKQKEPVVEPTSHELINVAKLAMENGELEIAGKYLAKTIRKQKLENVSSERNTEPYVYLAEILEQTATKDNVGLLQKQRFLLQAAALYNFVSNCLKTTTIESESSVEMKKTISRKLLDIQDSLVSMTGGNPLRCNFDPENKKKTLEQLRNEVKGLLETIECHPSRRYQEVSEEDRRSIFIKQTVDIKNLCKKISLRLKGFLTRIIEECMEVLGDPPCNYEVLVLGSLAREEMTPYSDLEWAILISSEEEKCKVFFRNLTNLVHLQIINLGETILPGMGITILSGDWFYDDVTPRGVSFDGFLPQACKTPLGNMEDFELIHTPTHMTDFQSNCWYEKNPSLGEILLTVAPLDCDKHNLFDVYRMELGKRLDIPCDSKLCHHDLSSTNHPSRGTCRGMRTLRKDVSRYGEVMTGNNEMDDGKLYDVKKEIYRLTDRVVAGLAECIGIRRNGAFEILEELHVRGIITTNARDNLASAAAIALKLRLSTYLVAGKQGEQMNSTSGDCCAPPDVKSVYHMPSEEELYHFFYVAIPLYDELYRFIEEDDNHSECFLQHAFFDCSDAVKGNIHCRVLNYPEALQCYERALQADPENLSLKIRRMRIELITNVHAVKTMRDDLDALLRNLSNETQGGRQRNDAHLESHGSLLTGEDKRLLLEILLFTAEFYRCQRDFSAARTILYQCRNMAKKEGTTGLQVMMMKSALTNSCIRDLSDGLDELIKSDAISSQATSLIENEGVTSKSIIWLNNLGEFLFVQGKYEEAYQCLQRALTMGRILFGVNANLNVMTTLTGLGMVSMNLQMFEESKYYFQQLLKLVGSFSGPRARMELKQAYQQLAMLCIATNHHEEAISISKEGLALTTGFTGDAELNFDCAMHSRMAISWHVLNEPEKSWKSALDAKECLRSIVDVQARVPMTCLVAMVFDYVGRNKESILLMQEGLQELNSRKDVKHKAVYQKCLGEAYTKQSLTTDAKRCYNEALGILLVSKEDTSAIVDCFLGIANVSLINGNTSEARNKLDEAMKYTSSVTIRNDQGRFMKRIGTCWEKLGDINEARDCYDKALALSKESTVTTSVPFFEFDLHVKLGELAKHASSNESSLVEFRVLQEQRMKAERIHYDRAGEVLRRHSASGQFNSTTILLFLLLASKYRSIDSIQQEKLLLEALEMSKVVYGSYKPSEMVSCILLVLSDFYGMKMDTTRASEFLEACLRMEMELHSSDPYHPHICHQLPMLSYLYFKNPGRKELEDIIHCVLEFLERGQKEEASISSISKPKAAKYFTEMGFLYLLLGNIGKAETLNNLASGILEGVVENSDPEDMVLNTTICDMMKKSLDEIKILPTSENILSVIKETHCQRLLKRILLNYSPRTRRILENGISLDQKRITTAKNPAELPSTRTGGDQLSRELQTLESKRQVLTTLADSTVYDLKKGRIGLAGKTMERSLNPLVTSMFERCPFDFVQRSINDAVKAMENGQAHSALYFLNLAEQFPSNTRRRARILKLRGKCHLSSSNYRIAALSFIEAANCHFADRTADPEALGEHCEILIGLTKSHMLCNDVQGAWLACQEGMSLVSGQEPAVSKSQQETELFFLGAKCMIHLASQSRAHHNDLEKAVSFCQQALASSRKVDESMGCDDLREELVGSDRGEIFALKEEVLLLLATALLRLKKTDESCRILKEMVEFLTNIAVVFETYSKETWPGSDVEFFKISRRLYSWIGQALVMSGETSMAMNPLTKSLSASLALGLPDGMAAEDELVALLDSITAIKTIVAEGNCTPFQQTIELCKQTFLQRHDDLEKLQRLFKNLGNFYDDRLRTEEAIAAMETRLTIVQCMVDSNEAKLCRERTLLGLANTHRKQALKNTGESKAHERSLAEKYYQIDRQSTRHHTAVKDVGYANFLCEEGRFSEALAVLEQLTQGSKDSWDANSTEMMMFCSYSSRYLYGPGVQKFIDENGELLTLVGNVAYSTLVRVYVEMRMKKEAVAACEKLSACGKDLPVGILSFRQAPLMPYVLGACHQALLSLVDDQYRLQFQNSNFPLSAGQLAKLYYGLNEYELTLEYCEKARMPCGFLPGEQTGSTDCAQLSLSCLCLSGNALVMLKRENESYSYFTAFLEQLQRQEGILDKPFDKQKIILAQYSFARQYYVFRSLGKLLSERGIIDGAIECYELCLDSDRDFNCDQRLVGTLAELYQSKALTSPGNDKATYAKWINAAQACFEKLLQKTTKLLPFVELCFASFLRRQKRFQEAIPHFENVVEGSDETEISFSGEDKPLVGAYLEKEIEARDKIILPLKVYSYYEMVSAYLKLKKVENAQESALQMENYVTRFKSTQNYPLLLSVLGYAQKEMGNEQAAKNIFLTVLELSPGHSPVMNALESCSK